MRGHVRSRLDVYVLYDIWGDLGSTVRTRTYKIRFWKLLPSSAYSFVISWVVKSGISRIGVTVVHDCRPLQILYHLQTHSNSRHQSTISTIPKSDLVSSTWPHWVTGHSSLRKFYDMYLTFWNFTKRSCVFDFNFEAIVLAAVMSAQDEPHFQSSLLLFKCLKLIPSGSPLSPKLSKLTCLDFFTVCRWYEGCTRIPSIW